MTLIGAFIFALFALFMIPRFVWTRARVAEMRTWPSTSAHVVASNVEPAYYKYEGKKYEHKIAYTYAIGNSSFRGDRVSYGDRPPGWDHKTQARRSPTLSAQAEREWFSFS